MKKKVYKYRLKKTPSVNYKNYKIVHGNFGIKSISNSLLNSRHIENIRRKLSKQFKKLNNINKTKIYIKLYRWKPYTNKPLLSRMGKGAGAVAKWQTFINKGMIFIEISTIEKIKEVSIIFKKSVKNIPTKLLLVQK